MFDRILNSPLLPLIIFAKVLAICLLNVIKIFHHISSITVFRRVTRGGGGRSPPPFFRILKKCIEFRKNFGIGFSFVCCRLNASGAYLEGGRSPLPISENCKVPLFEEKMPRLRPSMVKISYLECNF